MFIFSMSFNSLKVKGAATSLNLNYQRILKRSLPHLMIRKLLQRMSNKLGLSCGKLSSAWG